MKNFRIKSYCKINLSLKTLKKLKNGYHDISSLITFCDLYDAISISQTKFHKDIINFSGKFRRGIDKKFNTITKVLRFLREKKLIKNKTFKINVKKNIPQGSGLGGGSLNASSLLNFFNKKMQLNLNNNQMNNLAKKIGSDVPIGLIKKNTYLKSGNRIVRLNSKFNLNLIIVYPNIVCSTKNIYKKHKIDNHSINKKYFYRKNKKELISYLLKEKNDLETTVIKIYPKIKELINFIKFQKGCFFSRITGSGSACIGIFSNTRNVNFAKKAIRSKYPKYWCFASKTI